jgi:hypothetical protein
MHKIELWKRSKQELELDYQHQKWIGAIEPDPSDLPMTIDDFIDDSDAILEESFDS